MRDDRTKQVISKNLTEKRGMALQKLEKDQRRHLLQEITDDLGLEIEGMWGSMDSDDGECG